MNGWMFHLPGGDEKVWKEASQLVSLTVGEPENMFVRKVSSRTAAKCSRTSVRVTGKQGGEGPVQRTKWTRVNRYAPFPAFRLPCLFSVFPAQGNLMSDSRSNKEYEIKMCGWPDVYLSSRRAAVLFSFSCALFKAVISWFKLRRMTEAYV